MSVTTDLRRAPATPVLEQLLGQADLRVRLLVGPGRDVVMSVTDARRLAEQLVGLVIIADQLDRAAPWRSPAGAMRRRRFGEQPAHLAAATG